MRVAIWVFPILVGFAAGSFVARALPEPSSAYEVVFWWASIIAVATVTSTATDRLSRRLLPLTVLLKMTMLFPDAAPSRLRMARRAGNVSELRRRIHEAQNGQGDPDLAEMAELILSLSAALSNHDRKTRGHSERTRAYTDMIAEEMGLKEADRDRLRWAALLHDVGKLEVPTEVLNKDSDLTDDEWELIRQHPINGMKLVGPLIPWLGQWAKTIEHHHERYDGTGYPHGLAGEQISLGARIVAVADAYDVMTSGRAYQRAKTPSEARREVAAMAGVQFDPVVARALMNVSLGKLRWSTGPIAVLAEIPFIRGFPQVGRDLAMVMTTSAVMTTGFVTGAVPTPEGIDISPGEIVEVVIAGAGLRQDSDMPSGTPDDLPLAAGESMDPGTDQDTLGDDGVDGTTTTLAPGTTGPTTSGTTTPGTTTPGTDPPGTNPPGTTTPPGTDPPTTTTTSDTTTSTTAPGTTTTTTTPPNNPPVAPSRSATTDEGVLVSVPLGYSDPDGDPLACTLAAPPAVGSATVPASCSALDYSPPASHDGNVTVQVRVSDGTATVTGIVTITVVGGNVAPVAVDDSATSAGSPVSVPVLANDSDPDGDPITIGSVGSASGGTATASGSSVTFTPAAGFSGTGGFTYTVCDDGGLCDTGSVSVTVTTAAPVVANNDSATVKKNDKVNITVLSNDTGPIDEGTLSLGGATGGSVSILGGSGRVKFEADPGFTGTATFTYTICSAAGGCDTATVSVQVG